jgi:hypothetical protein
VQGFCTCEQEWSGEGCEVYTGACDSLCDSCIGPELADCTACVQNSTLVDKCECDPGFSGPSCELWSGPCAAACLGCFGPTADQCVVCIEHAEVSGGYCQCLPDWGVAANCSVYVGTCDRRCSGVFGNQTRPNTCYGPSNSDCFACSEHAHYDHISGACVCDDFWSGVDCSIWEGPCDARCTGLCLGPGNTDCVACVPNASMTLGACLCDVGWTVLDDCTGYSADCGPTCQQCA